MRKNTKPNKLRPHKRKRVIKLVGSNTWLAKFGRWVKKSGLEGYSVRVQMVVPMIKIMATALVVYMAIKLLGCWVNINF